MTEAHGVAVRSKLGIAALVITLVLGLGAGTAEATSTLHQACRDLGQATNDLTVSRSLVKLSATKSAKLSSLVSGYAIGPQKATDKIGIWCRRKYPHDKTLKRALFLAPTTTTTTTTTTVPTTTTTASPSTAPQATAAPATAPVVTPEPIKPVRFLCVDGFIYSAADNASCDNHGGLKQVLPAA
jgi:hypothetical protein